jgi:hypothetical protein
MPVMQLQTLCIHCVFILAPADLCKISDQLAMLVVINVVGKTNF